MILWRLTRFNQVTSWNDDEGTEKEGKSTTMCFDGKDSNVVGVELCRKN